MVNLRGVTEIIDDAASRKLVKSGIDLDILTRHPYTICSVEDLETAIQIIEKVGIQPFFSKKATCECRKWDIRPVLCAMYSRRKSRMFAAIYSPMTGSVFIKYSAL